MAGLPAFDIYLLSDSSGWPEQATFTYVNTVFEATDLPADLHPYTIDV